MDHHTSKTRPDSPGDAAVNHAFIRGFLVLLFVLTAGAWSFIVWYLWPYLVLEHQRMRSWQSMMIWIGDATVALAFLRFFVLHGLFGKRLPVKGSSGKGRGRGVWRIALISVIIGLVCDLVMTSVTAHDEQQGYDQRTVATKARVENVGIRKRTHKETTSLYYYAPITYKDRENMEHHGVFHLRGQDLDYVTISKALKADLQERQAGFEVDIHYDAECPGRYWTESPGWPGHEDGLTDISYGLVVGQLVFLAFFLIAVYGDNKENTDSW